MKASPHLVFAGAATVDMILSVDHLPTGPGKILPRALVQAAHGMATSAATAAARLGAKSSLIARIGNDAMGDFFINQISGEGVDCRHVRRLANVPTPICPVIVDNQGERLALPYYDKGLDIDADWVSEDVIASADAVQVDVRWPPAAHRLLSLARANGKIAVLDGDIGPVAVLDRLARLATHSVFSAPAALLLSGQETIENATSELARRFAGFVAVTDGPSGCFWIHEGQLRNLRPPEITAVDTLAAGDVFHGAFTLALAEGNDIEHSIRFSNAAAALKCTVFGGRLGAPTRREVELFLAAS